MSAHTLAEELERRLRRLLCRVYAGGAAYMDDGEAQDNRAAPIIDFLRDSLDDIEEKMERRALAALRSSPSEQDARDAGRYRLIRRVSLPEWERLGHYTEEALDEQIDAAIAASDAKAQP